MVERTRATAILTGTNGPRPRLAHWLDGSEPPKPGDRIVKIDGTEVQGLTLNEAVDKMRGAINSPIVLTIVRDKKEPFDQKLVRDRIRVQSVKYNVENGDIG